MKLTAPALAFALMLGGCVTAAQTDKSQAWADCEKMLDRASQSSCMTKALSDANADRRAAEAREMDDFEKDTKAIEDKAAIEQALGAPASETGTNIVRKPF